VAEAGGNGENNHAMKFTPRTLLLLVLIGLQSLIIAGCANTGRGIKRDTERNIDKVKNELDH
jgi:predicted small secreted protein